MTANPSLASLSEEQKNLVYNVREIYPALDTTDCVNLCKSCNWNRDIVNSTLAESNSSFGDSKWKEIDRSSKRKKKEGDKTNFSDGFTYNVSKKKKAFNRRQRRGKNFDRKGRGAKPTKDRKSYNRDWKKRGENSDQSRAKHLIQRTNAVTNTSAGSWAAKARAPPRPDPRPTSSPQRDPSSKSENSRKENEVSNSSSDIGPPPGIITTSVWTEVNHTEPEVNHAEQYPDFFDTEQFNTQSHLVEPETKKIYPSDNLSSFQDTQIYPGTKFSEPAVKPDLTAFQIDHDRRSSTSQYSRPIENIESIGVDIRIGTEGPPDYNIPVEPFHSEHPHQYQFGEIVNTGASENVDGRSRPVSDNSSAVGGTPFHSIHSSAKDNRVDHSRAVQISKGGVTMPPANSMMFPSSSQQDRGSISMFGSLVLPPEQEQLKTGGTAVYQFGVDFSEERKMESNELHHPPPNHLPAHVLGDPTQQVLQRPGRMDYADRPPYQPPPRAIEVSHDMNRTVNMNRNSHDLNLHSHPIDTHFSNQLDAPNSTQHGKFEDIGPSIMDSTRDPHGRPQHLGHQRLESHFEERKSNHTEIDDSRNQNRINNIQPMHMAAPRSFSRPDNIRSVPAEITEPFFNEAKRMEPSNTRGFDEPQPDFQNHHTPYVPNPPQAFKPKQNTGFKDAAGYVQPAPYGVEQLQNLEGDKTGPSSTPPLVNANTEYKQHHFYGTNQITYYPHVPQAYTTAPVPTYQPQYTTAPRTNVYSYSAAQVMSTNPVYPSYSQPVLPSYSMT